MTNTATVDTNRMNSLVAAQRIVLDCMTGTQVEKMSHVFAYLQRNFEETIRARKGGA